MHGVMKMMMMIIVMMMMKKRAISVIKIFIDEKSFTKYQANFNVKKLKMQL
jgi:hypothetical protein